MDLIIFLVLFQSVMIGGLEVLMIERDRQRINDMLNVQMPALLFHIRRRFARFVRRNGSLPLVKFSSGRLTRSSKWYFRVVCLSHLED